MITIIDGNFLFYRACKVNYLDTDLDKRTLIIRKFIRDVIYASQHLSNKKGKNKTILVVDSKSWRRDNYTEYKANRDHSDIDFSIYDECLDMIKYNDICTIHKIEKAEGDDIITLWKEYCFTKKEPLMIVSIDGDMKQLLSLNPLVLIFSEVPKYEKVFVAKGFKEMIEEETKKVDNTTYLLNLSNKNNSIKEDFLLIKNFIEKKVVEEIDTNFVLWEKVLSGDSSDNIPSVWRAEKGRKKKVDSDYLERVLDITGYITPKSVYESDCDVLIEAIEKVYNQPVLDRIGFRQNFERNYKLIVLDSDNFPESIKESFEPIVSEKNGVNFNSLFDKNKNVTDFVNSSGKTFDFKVPNKVTSPTTKSIMEDDDLSWLLAD